MKDEDIRKNVVKILKKRKGHADIEEIVNKIMTVNVISDDERRRIKNQVAVVLTELDPFLVSPPEDPTKFRFRHKFGPKPVPVAPEKRRFAKVHPPTAVSLEYTADVSNLAQLDQDEVGDCVGCSGATLSKQVRFKILQIPTPSAQLAAIQRSVKTSDGVVVDILPDDTVSAAAIYNMARARMTPLPSDSDDGALVTDAAEVLEHQGIVPEWMWPTAKTEATKYKTPPANMVALVNQTLPLHMFDGGWSVIEDPSGDPGDQVIQAVMQYGGCWMAMPVFDNYGQCSPSGDFPDPITGVSKIVGYHAICIVGRKKDSTGKLRWQFVNSWYGYTPLVNTISNDGYFLPYFKSGDIQLISIGDSHAVPFPERNPVPTPVPNPAPAPAPAPVPTPTPTPNPAPDIGFWEQLIEAIISFIESIFGKRPGKPVSA